METGNAFILRDLRSAVATLRVQSACSGEEEEWGLLSARGVATPAVPVTVTALFL